MLEQEPSSIIGFDGSRLTGRSRTGTETYAFELLNSLTPLARPGELRVYLNADESPEVLPAGLEPVLMPSSRLWTHGRLSWEMARNPPGLLFVPAHVIPAMHPLSVVTIHDLAFLIHPEAFSRRQRHELDLATRWNAKSATKIIAVSRRTKVDLVERYGTDPEKVVVIHHGVGQRFQPAGQDQIDRVRGAFGLNREFVLCVGTLHPRKNYLNIVAAFEHAVGNGLDMDLVICGESGKYASSTLQAIDSSPVRDRIHVLHYVDSNDLPPLYSGAALVMLASLYEGFGLPALEAMACGAPVAVSSTGALPEVVGHAARVVDPLDIDSIASAMLDIGVSAELRRRLSALGRRWALRFTWERSAALTMNVLRAVRDGREINDERLGWSDLAAAPPRTVGKDGEP